MTEFDIAVAILSLLILFGFLAGIVYERKDWNGGVCRDTGARWVRFAVDSGGGRGYMDGRGNYCWISYPFIDK